MRTGDDPEQRLVDGGLQDAGPGMIGGTGDVRPGTGDCEPGMIVRRDWWMGDCRMQDRGWPVTNSRDRQRRSRKGAGTCRRRIWRVR